MTAASKRHMSRVAALPCCVCGDRPVELHHVMEGRTPGRRSPDWLVIPLCVSCHRGQGGIHGDRSFWKIYKATELDCLADTLETLYGGA